MIVKPLPNQTLLDIAVQYLGDAGQAYIIAEMNGLNVTDSLMGITSLTLPDELVNAKLVQEYEVERDVPASQYTAPIVPLPDFLMTEGLGFPRVIIPSEAMLTEDGENLILE